MKKFNLVIICSIAASLKLLAATETQGFEKRLEAHNSRLELTKLEFTKNFDKTFTVDKNEVVFLANKYGKIEVKTGGTNQVVVNVRVRINANSQEEAQKIFDRINIAFSNGPDYVKTETIIESQSGSSWKWNSWGKSNSQDFTGLGP